MLSAQRLCVIVAGLGTALALASFLSACGGGEAARLSPGTNDAPAFPAEEPPDSRKSDVIPGSPTWPSVTGPADSHELDVSRPSARPDVILGSPAWPALLARTLNDLVQSYPVIAVGVVKAVQEVKVSRMNFDCSRWSPPPEKPVPCPANGVITGVETVFSVSVEKYLGSASGPSTIELLQTGGVVEGVSYGLTSDPLLQIGARFLFFLRDALPHDPPIYTGSPFGRFAVGGDGHIRPNGWESLAGVSAVSAVSFETVKQALVGVEPERALSTLAGISGATLDEAAAKITAAINGAAIPTPVPATPSPTPTSSPTPAPSPAAAP